MIRLTVLLLAGIWAAFWLAGDLPGPVPRPAATGAPGLAERLVAALEADAAPLPLAATGARASDVTLTVPFLHPVVIGPDGQPVPGTDAPGTGAAVLASIEPAPDTPVASAPPAGTGLVLYVSAERVNVREGPSTDFPVVGQVEYAEAVLLVADAGNGWSEIRVEGDGTAGFVASRFLQQTDPLP